MRGPREEEGLLSEEKWKDPPYSLRGYKVLLNLYLRRGLLLRRERKRGVEGEEQP